MCYLTTTVLHFATGGSILEPVDCLNYLTPWLLRNLRRNRDRGDRVGDALFEMGVVRKSCIEISRMW